MTRILHVAGDSKFGGGGIVILDLVDGAIDQGYEVAVLTTDPVFQEKLRRQDVPCVAIDVIRRPIRPIWDLRGLFRLVGYLRREHYEVIHTHTSKGGFVGRFAARIARVPVIVHTVHGFAFHEQSGLATRAVYVLLEKIAAYACDRIITVSEYHRRLAARFGIGRRGRVVSIPNGLNAERVEPTKPRTQIREELGLAPDVVALAIIGRLAEQKGIEFALEAIAMLERDHLPPFCLVLAGDGPLAGKLAETAKELAIDDLVSFLGFRDDVGDVLNAADIVVMPSLWEGLSISLLEAMAARKPIVTTSIPSNEEVSEGGRCAVLVPRADGKELSTAVAGLIRSPADRDRLATLAYERFKSFYTHERMVNEYLSQYRELLGLAGLS